MPFLFCIEISSYCSGLADLTSRRTLVWPNEAPRFDVVVASNNPAVNTLRVNGEERSGTWRLGKEVRPALRIFWTVMDTWCKMNLSIVAVDVAVFV